MVVTGEEERSGLEEKSSIPSCCDPEQMLDCALYCYPFNNYLPLPLNNELDPQKANEGCAAACYCQGIGLLQTLHLYQKRKERNKE
jgi:hypothetical protein